jgi:cytochrome b6-f complex iron-sulfur subunit
MDRREVIQRVLKGTTALILVPSFLASCEKEQVLESEVAPVAKPDSPKNNLVLDISSAEYSGLKTAGGSKVVEGIIIANTGNTGFVALSSACTHQGTQLTYNSRSNRFECFSHGSMFSPTGSVIMGPASIALQSFAITRSGDLLTIVR